MVIISRFNKLMIVCAMGILAVSGSMFVSMSASAITDEGEGGGGSSNNTHDVCSNPKKYRYSSTVCKKGTKGYPRGGGSWVAFKTKPEGKTHDGGIYNGIAYNKSIVGTGYENMSKKCPYGTYDYVWVWTYQGWKKDSTESAYWGPLKLSAKNKGYTIHLNKHGAKTAGEINEAYAAGENIDKWKVTGKTGGGALSLYNKYKKDTKDEIPSSVGFFCYAPDISVEANARTTSGTLIGDKNPFFKETKQVGETVRITYPGAKLKDSNGKEYTFIGWSSASSGSEVELGTATTLEHKVNREIMKVYAVYSDCNGPNCSTPGTPTTAKCEDWTPASYTSSNANSGETSVLTKVKNDILSSGNPYSKWSGGVDSDAGFTYAKPTDPVSWVHCYYPGVQKVANTEVTTNHYTGNGLDAGAESDGSPDNTYSLGKNKIMNVDSWSNYFNISMDFTGSTYSPLYHSFNNGTYNGILGPYLDNTYKVASKDVGKKLKEGITSGTPTSAKVVNKGSHSWNCHWTPKTCSSKTCDSEGNCTTTSYDCSYWKDTCRHSQSFIAHWSGGSAKKASAVVKVPYNFYNRTRVVDSNTKSGIEYAGEETNSVRVEVANLPRTNSITEGTYATKSDNTWVKLQVCYSGGVGGGGGNDGGGSDYSVEEGDEGGDYSGDDDEDSGFDDGDEGGVGSGYYTNDPGANLYSAGCSETQPVKVNDGSAININGTVNSYSNAAGVVTKPQTIPFNVPDATAGTQVCVRSAVYPKDSHDNENLSSSAYSMSDSNSWAYSQNQVCYTVAKKPSMQVWGGNIYSRGNIDTSISAKEHRAGYYAYNPDTIHDGYTTYYFGSWGELGLIASGGVTGFGTGATMGYDNNNDGTPWPRYTIPPTTPGVYTRGNNASIQGGSGGNTSSFCVRSPLTLANSQCGGGKAGLIGLATGTNQAERDKSKVINRLIPNDKSGASVTTGSLNLNNGKSYYYSTGSLTVPGYVATELGAVKVVHAEGDITINGNLEYANRGYISLFDLPKIVVYSEKNIKIACGVTRIDALLVADGNVKTCGESNDFDDSINSNQLIINGAVIANTLDANRTYGSATGANSVIPAEIINFDPTLYLWAGESDNGEADNKGLNTTYITELAPRR